jgi:hypothetical protein
MTEPTIEAAEQPDKPRRWPIYLTLGLVVALVGGFFGNRVLYSSDFDHLVDLTATAEGHQVWKDFFIAQDCFIAAVIDDQNPDLAYTDGLELRDETGRLADHVDAALETFASAGVKPWHGPLRSARDAISEHYRIWDEHLVDAQTILESLSELPDELVVTFQVWVDSVVEAQDPITETFEGAEAAFNAAAPSPAAAAEIDTLFTGSDVGCTRGSV